MKVLAIHGQSHLGSTYNVSHYLLDNLDGEVEEIFLPKELNHFCLGCYSCLADETKCPFWEDKKKILDKMEKADILVFTTPTYCMAPSAGMKTFLDLFFDLWMVHKPKPWMFNKKVVIISTSAGSGEREAIKTIKNNLAGWGISYIKTYGESVAARNFDEIKEKRKLEMQKDLQKLAQKLNSSKNARANIKTKLMFNIFALMHKKGFDSHPSEKIYWQENGWLDKQRPYKDKKVDKTNITSNE